MHWPHNLCMYQVSKDPLRTPNISRTAPTQAKPQLDHSTAAAQPPTDHPWSCQVLRPCNSSPGPSPFDHDSSLCGMPARTRSLGLPDVSLVCTHPTGSTLMLPSQVQRVLSHLPICSPQPLKTLLLHPPPPPSSAAALLRRPPPHPPPSKRSSVLEVRVGGQLRHIHSCQVARIADGLTGVAQGWQGCHSRTQRHAHRVTQRAQPHSQSIFTTSSLQRWPQAQPPYPRTRALPAFLRWQPALPPLPPRSPPLRPTAPHCPPPIAHAAPRTCMPSAASS